MDKYLAFSRFHTAEQAAELISLLQANQIPVQYEEEVVLMDKVYVGQNFDQRHLVKIPASHFASADALLKNQITVSPEEVEPDYYLLSFSTKELKDVIANKDEWGHFDYALATKLLEKQGISYSAAQLEELGRSRLETLAKPKDLPMVWVVIGFLSPVISFVPLPFFYIAALLGFYIAGFVLLTKKTLPDGSRVRAFSAKTRNRGRWMLLSNIILTALCWLAFLEMTDAI
ncbi:hypothetical protein ACWKWU_13785 [Chitinophaga lutea]